MQYKTIILEMLEQRTELHEQLRQQRKLLKAVEMYVKELKASYEAIKEQIQEANPGSDPAQVSSEAFEIALKEMEDHLSRVSPTDIPEALSLDGAMAFIRSHTRRH